MVLESDKEIISLIEGEAKGGCIYMPRYMYETEYCRNEFKEVWDKLKLLEKIDEQKGGETISIIGLEHGWYGNDIQKLRRQINAFRSKNPNQEIRILIAKKRNGRNS